MLNQTRLIEQFQALVRISSPSRHERRVADYLKQLLPELGLSVEEDSAGAKIGGDAGNLIARVPGGSGPVLMFCAHMDTVQPGEGIVPVLADGIFTSEGETVLGGDDKAGITAILELLRILKEDNLDHPPLVIVFTVGEEISLQGAKALDIQALGADMGFCLDAGGPIGAIVRQGPAQNHLHAVIHGKAAHAGICPEQGVSAIQIAAEAIMRTKLGRVDEETTANIGLINGGKATNIIPASVELEGEARSVVEAKLVQQTEHMVETIQRVAEQRGGQAEVTVTNAYPVLSLTEEAEVIQLAVRAAQTIGIKPQVISTGGGADANIFNDRGLPTANLAIGMEKVHSTAEFIRVQDMEDLTKLLLAITKLAQA